MCARVARASKRKYNLIQTTTTTRGGARARGAATGPGVRHVGGTRRVLSLALGTRKARCVSRPAGGPWPRRASAPDRVFFEKVYTPRSQYRLFERRYVGKHKKACYTYAIDPSRRAPSRGATWTAATPALPPLLRCAAPTHARARHSHRARGSTRTPTASCHARQPHRGDVAGREVVGEAAGRAATRTIPSWSDHTSSRSV